MDTRPEMSKIQENALKLYLTWMKRAIDLVALSERVPDSVAKDDNAAFISKALVIQRMAEELATAIPFLELSQGVRPSVPLSQSLPFLAEYLKVPEV